MKFFQAAELIQSNVNSASFSLSGAGKLKRRLEISSLELNIFRISMRAENGFLFPKTWSVAWGDCEVPYEGRDRQKLGGFSCPPLHITATDRGWLLQSKDIAVHVSRSPYYLEWFHEKMPVLSERKTGALAVDISKNHLLHCYTLAEDAQFFGLGEKAGPLNKRGQKYEMRNVDAMGYDAEFTDPLYKHFPFLIYRSQKKSVGIFYDSFTTSTFDLGKEIDNYHEPFFSYRSESGDLDYYFIAGPGVRDVSETFTKLTGRPMMPPKWSLSYSGSSMKYTDSENAQEALLEFIKKTKEHELTCHSFHLSSGYTSIGQRRYVFHWNEEKFPNPTKLVQDFRNAGIKLIPNIKPVLLTDHPLYKTAKEKNLFISETECNAPELSQFWDGKGSHLDFSNPRTIQFWKNQIQEKLLHYGFDSLWNDNNEFEVWDDEASCVGFGNSWPIKWGRSIQTLLMAMSSRDALLENNPNERPFVISRSGMPGMQRYVQTWSGDNKTEWKTLRFNLWMALGLSLSGVSNTGHDVGGFSGPLPSSELFLRWIQHGIFYPRFVIHSWKERGQVNEPWMYPEILPAIKEAFRLREKLEPYFYNQLKLCHDQCSAFLRPLFYDCEEDERCFDQNDEFMVGESILVANILDSKLQLRPVYLPNVSEGWFDFETKQWFAGGSRLELAVTLNSIPIFVRGNSILPLKDSEDLKFVFFPTPRSEQNISYSYYEDDGIHFPFNEALGLSWTIHASISTDGRATLRFHRQGKFVPKRSRILFQVIGAKSIEAQGQLSKGDEVSIVF